MYETKMRDEWRKVVNSVRKGLKEEQKVFNETTFSIVKESYGTRKTDGRRKASGWWNEVKKLIREKKKGKQPVPS